MPRRPRIRWADVLLLGGLLLAYLVGNGRPALFDRDESRYAVTSLNMLRSGDWVVPRLLGEVRTAKPPAVYWMQATSIAVFGENESAVRLPGALACCAAAGVLRFGLAPVIGRRRAWWTAFVTGTTVLTFGVAKVGVTDGPLLLCACAMWVGLLRVHERWAWIAIWGAIGIAGLIKGPVLLAILLATGVASLLLGSGGGSGVLNRAKQALTLLKPVRGVLLVLLICAPWLVAVTVREPGFISTSLSHDIFRRSVQGLEGHGQPPGFHLLVLPATFFPWSVLLPGALVGVVIAWRRRGKGWMGLAIAGAIGPWLMFELVTTKLPHYLLPIFPLLAMVVADWIVRATRGRLVADLRGLRIGAMIFALVFALLAAAPLVLVGGQIGLVALLLTAPAIWAAWPWWKGRVRRGCRDVGVAMTLVVAVMYTVWLASVPDLTVSRRVAEELERLGAPSAAMIEYKEPSLAWYANVAEMEVSTQTPASLAGDQWRFAVITRGEFGRLSPEVAERWQIRSSIGVRLYNDSLRAEEVLVIERVTEPMD